MTNEVYEKRCDRCQHYFFIDSGYGECHYLPPALIWVKLFSLRYRAMYPHIPWDSPVCSKFLLRKQEAKDEG